IDGQRQGPVSEHEFARLVAAGAITGDTLVWRQGREEWAPWSPLADSHPLPDVGAAVMVPPAMDSGGTAGGAAGDAAASDWTLDEFTQRLRANGYGTSIEGCLSRAWANCKNGYLVGIGVVVVAYLIMFISGMLPLVSILATVLVTPHLTAGVVWYFLRRS